MCFVAVSGFAVFYRKLTNRVLRYSYVRSDLHSVEIKTVIPFGTIFSQMIFFFLLQPLSTFQLELKSAVMFPFSL